MQARIGHLVATINRAALLSKKKEGGEILCRLRGYVRYQAMYTSCHGVRGESKTRLRHGIAHARHLISEAGARKRKEKTQC